MKEIEKQKEELKARMSEEIDKYYEEIGKSRENKSLKIGEIERMLVEKKAELSAMLRESTGEWVSEQEVEKKKCGECGRRMRVQKREQEIKLKTLGGEVKIKRTYQYCVECGYGECPYDEEIGIDRLPYKITQELMVEAAYYGQNQGSFKEASELMKRAIGIEINAATLREVTEIVGRKVYESDRERAKKRLSKIDKIEIRREKAGTLYIEMDGASVNTRVEDENGSTWRENKTVMAFTDKDMIKRADGSHIITKKEYMAYIGSAEEFKAFVLDVAVRAGYGKIRNVVVIADGAAWIRNMCEEIFPDAVQIVDLYHLKENIYSYAKHKFGGDAGQYTIWAETIIKNIENGRIDAVLDSLPDEEKLPAGTVNLKSYIANNRDKINYSLYTQNGWFVGSGAIESANKLIVQRRLKQAGMRWSVQGAQALLSLRAKVQSNLWYYVRSLFSA